MLLKRAACAGLLAFSGLALAQQSVKPAVHKTTAHRPAKASEPVRSVDRSDPRRSDFLGGGVSQPGFDAAALTPREPLAKTPTEKLTLPATATGRLLVKFNDDVKARPVGGEHVISLVNQQMGAVDEIIQVYGVRLVGAINHSQDKLAELEARAAVQSGRAQPDLAGMMYVEGARDDATLLAVARALNALPTVEFVTAELPAATRSPDRGAQPLRRAPLQPQVMTAGELVERTKQTLGLTKTAVASLDVPEFAGAPVEVRVPIEGVPVTLSLQPHSVRTDTFQMYEALPGGNLLPIPPFAEGTVRGEVKEFVGSVVAGSFLSDGLVAMIKLPSGTRYWIEPIASNVPGAAPGQHAIYKSEDTTSEGVCGVDDDAPGPIGGGGGGGGGGGAPIGPCAQPYNAEIALDLDSQWVARAGSIENAGLLASAVIDVLNIQYVEDVGIRHVISAIVVRPSAASDPYTTINAGDLLRQFTIEWETNNTGIQRDIAHLFTGRELAGSVIGVAWLFGVCADGSGP